MRRMIEVALPTALLLGLSMPAALAESAVGAA